MSSIVDWQIRELALSRGMIQPFVPEQLNPGSYDVTLSDKILIENSSRQSDAGPSRWVMKDIGSEPYLMRPNEFVLASIQELIRVPEDMEAEFCLKSSRGREGYNHVLSGYIDSGYEGNITLEIQNCSRFVKLPLYPGLRIGQIRFAYMNATPEAPYNVVGRYHMDTEVTPSKG